MVNNLSVKLKLAISTIIAVSGLTAITLLMLIAISNINSMNQALLKVETLQASMLRLRVNEKNFINNLDIDYFKKLNTNYEKLELQAKELKKLLNSYNINNKKINNFQKSLKEYKNTFVLLVKKQEQIGLHLDDGLYKSLKSSARKVQDIGDKVAYQTMNVKLLELRNYLREFILTKDKSFVKKFDKTLRKLRFVVRSNKTHISNEQKKQIYKALKKYKEDFLILVKAEEYKGFSEEKGLLKLLKNSAFKSEKELTSATKQIMYEVSKKAKTYKISAFLLAMVMIILCLVISYFIARQIVLNIKKFHIGLIDFFKFIDKSSLDISTIDIKTNDEFGKMAKIINKNIENTKLNIQKESELIQEATHVANLIKQGHLSKTINISSNNQTLNDLKDVINEMLKNMKNNIVNIIEVLDLYKNYDYRKKIDESLMSGSMQKLASGVNSVGKTVSNMLSESRNIGIYLQNDSNLLTNYVKDLSKISNQQAICLEETTAVIEEATTNIEQTNIKTKKMLNISNETKIASIKGKDYALKTVNSMNIINETVICINNAISVIDKIAFQTNILSLNAAVEAASAGELGKGFAVVAQEVRNLATRSAKAANEIKSLVQEAKTKANEGKYISTQMIDGFELLNKKIQESTVLVDDISKTTKEQSEVMCQINKTVALLDKNTQVNAKTAESTNIIAQKTNSLAIKVLETTNNKKFEGKEKIIIKSDKT